MYNFALAFVICALACILGEVISKWTKAWVPSVFITAVLFLLGYWTLIPSTVVADAKLLDIGGTMGIYFCIVHIGTLLSIRQLLAQWKTVVICLAGLAGMCCLCYFICPLLMEKELMIAGLPPLTGGIVATTMMKDAALEKGLSLAAVFAVSMYCIQGFAGYPLTAVCLQREGKKLLKSFRSGNAVLSASAETVQNAPARKKLIPPVPEKYDSVVVTLAKVAFTAWLSMVIGKATGISGAIVALLLSVVLTALGFLEQNALGKANSYGILSFALTLYIFDGLKDCTPQMLGQIIRPTLVLVIVGVIGLGIVAFVAAKVMKCSAPLAYATCLTALYGFPFNVVMTESVCEALTEDADEREYLKGQMLPPMLVGGFTTVTIASVVIAGIFVKLL